MQSHGGQGPNHPKDRRTDKTKHRSPYTCNVKYSTKIPCTTWCMVCGCMFMTHSTHPSLDKQQHYTQSKNVRIESVQKNDDDIYDGRKQKQYEYVMSMCNLQCKYIELSCFSHCSTLSLFLSPTNLLQALS